MDLDTLFAKIKARHIHTCVVCGKTFEHYSPVVKYCSPQCRRAFYNKQRKQFHEELMVEGDPNKRANLKAQQLALDVLAKEFQAEIIQHEQK
jgi:predicted nucleic acid-binding Zn ribbon protein